MKNRRGFVKLDRWVHNSHDGGSILDWTRKIREQNRVALAKVGSPSNHTLLCVWCGGLRGK